MEGATLGLARFRDLSHLRHGECNQGAECKIAHQIALAVQGSYSQVTISISIRLALTGSQGRCLP